VLPIASRTKFELLVEKNEKFTTNMNANELIQARSKLIKHLLDSVASSV
jgi:hypothetical protein